MDEVLKMLKQQRAELIKMNASKKALDDIDRKIHRERVRLEKEAEAEDKLMMEASV